MTDIVDLFKEFKKFGPDAILGIANDMQPVYKHMLYKYRNQNPNSRIGMPPPDGLTGFNSGVLLLDLKKMRESKLYNSLLNSESVEQLTKKFMMKGHLGDQDFFSLLSFEYESLFHVLPCQWNYQLCTWWYDVGSYKDLKKYYHDQCKPPVKIYHGNCNTPIPSK